jgi:UDP-N-acetylglucosamine acyltransferase
VSNIHPTAIVDAAAQLDSSVQVGPYTLIGPHVKIGAGTTVAGHVVIEGHTTIGRDNRIFQFGSIGAANQDKKYAGEPCELVIGDRNTIREFVTLHIGTVQDKAVTRIGDDNWIMAYTHIAHDCVVGNSTTMANNTTLAGHVELGDWVTIGGLTGIHQFVKVGAHAMVGFASAVSQDVPPFMLVDGNPLEVRGFNAVGLRRRDFSAGRIAAVKQMHKLLYREGRTLDDARQAIAALAGQTPEAAQDVALMNGFLAAATRGIVR